MPTVLLTGASRGLGLEFARQYAAEGWRVIATARDPEKATTLRAIPGAVESHALDVADLAAAGRLAQRLDAPIDVLIANAGIAGPRGMSAEAVEGEAWAEVMRVNVMAPLALAGAFRQHLERGRERKAIAITSRLGSLASNNEGGMYAYRSSKAALNAVWRSFALDHKGLIAALLHPGWVRTDMGGPGGALAPAESVAAMRRVIAGLTTQDSGRFFNYDGAPLPW
jgi:NAD(P)-dependent dehydrogenase (short-subunit alcohol dehydrogenase family)